MFLAIIRRPAFISKQNILETGFCLSLQTKPTQFGPIDRASPYLRTPVRTPDKVHKPSTALIICESYDKTFQY
jgi:hypothetical protein